MFVLSISNLAQKDYLSYVTSLDKIYNKEKLLVYTW
ncbi:staphopain proregion domain-containing protein [Staphylococcus aureus]